MNVDIKRRKEHFEVYIEGKFFCTADNEREAAKEAMEYERNGGIRHENYCAQKKLQRSRAV